jgi:hypothetical protein
LQRFPATDKFQECLCPDCEFAALAQDRRPPQKIGIRLMSLMEYWGYEPHPFLWHPPWLLRKPDVRLEVALHAAA